MQAEVDTGLLLLYNVLLYYYNRTEVKESSQSLAGGLHPPKEPKSPGANCQQVV